MIQTNICTICSVQCQVALLLRPSKQTHLYMSLSYHACVLIATIKHMLQRYCQRYNCLILLLHIYPKKYMT